MLYYLKKKMYARQRQCTLFCILEINLAVIVYTIPPLSAELSRLESGAIYFLFLVTPTETLETNPSKVATTSFHHSCLVFIS